MSEIIISVVLSLKMLLGCTTHVKKTNLEHFLHFLP